MFKEEYKRENDRLHVSESVLERVLAAEKAEQQAKNERVLRMRRWTRIGAAAACFVFVSGAILALNGRGGSELRTVSVEDAGVFSMRETEEMPSNSAGAMDSASLGMMPKAAAGLNESAELPDMSETEGEITVSFFTRGTGVRVIAETERGAMSHIVQEGHFVSYELKNGKLILVTETDDPAAEASVDDMSVTVDPESGTGPYKVTGIYTDLCTENVSVALAVE